MSKRVLPVAVVSLLLVLMAISCKKDKPAAAGDNERSAPSTARDIAPMDVPALQEALGNARTAQERCTMVEALGSFGPGAAPAAEDVATALSDSAPAVRMMAAWTLGRIGPKAGSSAPVLVAALRDGEFYVRGNAAWALGQIGADSAAAVEALAKALGDDDVLVRRCAAEALGRLGAAAVPALTSVWKKAVTSPGAAGGRGTSVVEPELMALANMQGSDYDVRDDEDREAYATLRAAAVQALTRILGHTPNLPTRPAPQAVDDRNQLEEVP